jgi:hypothetical protein
MSRPRWISLDEWRLACKATVGLSKQERSEALAEYKTLFGEGGRWRGANEELNEVVVRLHAIRKAQRKALEPHAAMLGITQPVSLSDDDFAPLGEKLRTVLSNDELHSILTRQAELNRVRDEYSELSHELQHLLADKTLLEYRVGRLDSVGREYRPEVQIEPTTLPGGTVSNEVVVQSRESLLEKVNRMVFRKAPDDPWTWQDERLSVPHVRLVDVYILKQDSALLGEGSIDVEAVLLVKVLGGWSPERLRALRQAVASHLPGRHLWVLSPPGQADLLVWLADDAQQSLRSFHEAIRLVAYATMDLLSAWRASTQTTTIVPAPVSRLMSLDRIGRQAESFGQVRFDNKSPVLRILKQEERFKDSSYGDRSLLGELADRLHPPAGPGVIV